MCNEVILYITNCFEYHILHYRGNLKYTLYTNHFYFVRFGAPYFTANMLKIEYL